MCAGRQRKLRGNRTSAAETVGWIAARICWNDVKSSPPTPNLSTGSTNFTHSSRQRAPEGYTPIGSPLAAFEPSTMSTPKVTRTSYRRVELMSIQPFRSKTQLVTYAQWFLGNRVTAFRKDTNICMTADNKKHHAYFPALITCIAFSDFLSGLNAGNIKSHSLPELKDYIQKNVLNDRRTISTLTSCMRCFGTR